MDGWMDGRNIFVATPTSEQASNLSSAIIFSFLMDKRKVKVMSDLRKKKEHHITNGSRREASWT